VSGPIAKRIKERAFAKRNRVPCFYCETLLFRHEATVDHRIPWSKGGRNDPLNVVIACNACNQAKGDAMP
jgi:5-methylcytosine-specific restriction endonuclease McrA